MPCEFSPLFPNRAFYVIKGRNSEFLCMAKRPLLLRKSGESVTDTISKSMTHLYVTGGKVLSNLTYLSGKYIYNIYPLYLSRSKQIRKISTYAISIEYKR